MFKVNKREYYCESAAGFGLMPGYVADPINYSDGKYQGPGMKFYMTYEIPMRKFAYIPADRHPNFRKWNPDQTTVLVYLNDDDEEPTTCYHLWDYCHSYWLGGVSMSIRAKYETPPQPFTGPRFWSTVKDPYGGKGLRDYMFDGISIEGR